MQRLTGRTTRGLASGLHEARWIVYGIGCFLQLVFVAVWDGSMRRVRPQARRNAEPPNSNHVPLRVADERFPRS